MQLDGQGHKGFRVDQEHLEDLDHKETQAQQDLLDFPDRLVKLASEDPLASDYSKNSTFINKPYLNVNIIINRISDIIIGYQPFYE